MSNAKKDQAAISDQLRAAVRDSGKSGNVVAKESGIPQPTLSRFLAGANMSSAAVDKLAAYFGLVLKKERGK
jgi:hypothetical protein